MFQSQAFFYIDYFLPLYLLIVLDMCVCAGSCLTLCDLMDYTPPGSYVCGIFQARILLTLPTSSNNIPESSFLN